MLERIVSQQDKKALAALYIKYYLQVKHYINSRVDCLEDAEDLVQDVFIELSKGKRLYNGHRDVRNYILGIAKKSSIDIINEKNV